MFAMFGVPVRDRIDQATGRSYRPAGRCKGTIARPTGLGYHVSPVMIEDSLMRSTTVLAVAAAILAVPTVASAQIKQPQAQGGSTAAEQARTQELNRMQAEAARAQQNANVRGQQQYQAEVDQFQADNAANAAARAAYEAELAANRQARADYDAAYARWQADVAACTAGDYSRCQSTAPAPK
jgi:hypothetical protein